LIAYVDESGDEGTIGHGSRWLVFACILDTTDSFSDSLGSFVELAAKKISRQRQKRLPHFAKLSHADKRGVLELFIQADWDAVVVATDTTIVRDGSALAKPSYQYNYALRYVLERASQRAALAEEELTFIIERRRNFDLAGFRDYVRRLRDLDSTRMAWHVVSEDRLLEASCAQIPELCFADGVAHAMFKAIEPDADWKHYELAYAEIVRRHLWRRNGALLGSGLTFMPTLGTAQFLREYPWVSEWQKTP